MRLTVAQLKGRLEEQRKIADAAIADMHSAVAKQKLVVDAVLADVEQEMRGIKAPDGAQDKVSIALRNVARRYGVSR